MGLRFRQRVKICPGLYLNIGLGGVSMTAGVRGASITAGPKGAYLNTGIPGTGISFRQKIASPSQPGTATPGNDSPPVPASSRPTTELSLHSAEAEKVTTAEFSAAKEMLLKTYAEQRRLRGEIAAAEGSLSFAKFLRVVSCVLLVGFVIKWFALNVEKKKAKLDELKSALEGCLINLDIDFDTELEAAYKKMASAYEGMAESGRIWQVNSSTTNDRVRERTLARHSISRAAVRFDLGKVEGLKCSHDPFHVRMTSGSELFIYPVFLILRDQEGGIGIIGFREVSLTYSDSRFIEEEGVPPDSKVVGSTWKKTNKDGSPDRRFKGNYKIPIVLYGEFSLQSSSGLNECFQVSNREATKAFADAVLSYAQVITSEKRSDPKRADS